MRQLFLLAIAAMLLCVACDPPPSPSLEDRLIQAKIDATNREMNARQAQADRRSAMWKEQQGILAVCAQLETTPQRCIDLHYTYRDTYRQQDDSIAMVSLYLLLPLIVARRYQEVIEEIKIYMQSGRTNVLLLPEALFLKSRAHFCLGETAEAVFLLYHIHETYPLSAAAETARKIILKKDVSLIACPS